jgi:hypothetical protein
MRIIQQSGGAIDVESAVDQGTTFVVRLVEVETPTTHGHGKDLSPKVRVS